MKQTTAYVAFHPAPFPPTDVQLSPALVNWFSRADRALARLDSAASVVPDFDLFITMYIRDDTTRSNQIEGAQATLADVVEAEVARHDDERRDAMAETQDYITALDLALKRLTHRWTEWVEIPKSRATWPWLSPLVRATATTSRLNSSGYFVGIVTSVL